jgi:glycosyltransferase involved in cell wall biosynthesis
MLEGPKLRLSMIVKNEEKRYLKKMLESTKKYITDVVIIDDASTDSTVSLCEEILHDIPHVIIQNKESKFHNEWELRKQQWDESIKGNPDWILFLDADEIFEDSFAEGVKELIDDGTCMLYSFRLYDFWDEKNYRDDPLWNAHNTYRPFLLKYIRDFPYEFKETNQHCGRLPSNAYSLPNKLSKYRVKHYGWAKEEDRLEKYNRYLSLDPDGIYGSLAQYRSINDQNPNLTEWKENQE